MRAEAAGDPGPWRQQAILGRGRWDADALRDIVRDYVVEHLAADDAVLVIDETGFLKQGRASCGVGRQYTGSAGKITNCQIGVFGRARAMCSASTPTIISDHGTASPSVPGRPRRSPARSIRLRGSACRRVDLPWMSGHPC
jgi:SRSO17 transposase